MPIRILPFDNFPISPPDVSVIIPTFNRLLMLQEALASVYAQTYEGSAEVLVVNDSPRDEISAVIRRDFPGARLICHGENLGMSRARNRALAEAKGRYLAFLDDDDLWEPDYLKVQISSLESAKDAFAVSGLTVWNTRTGARKLLPQKPDLKRYASVAHHLLVVNFIRCPSSVVFPRNAMEKAGFFDEDSPLGSDYDLYLRCLIAGFRPVFTGAPLAVKRRHGAGQLTDPANWDGRVAARIARVGEFYPLIKRHFAVAPFRAVRAEICDRFAGRYFRQKRVLRGLRLLVEGAL